MKHVHTRVLQVINRGLTVLLVALIPAAISAQVAPEAAGGHSHTEWDIFLGYSYLAPNTVVTGEVKTQANCQGSRSSSATPVGNGLWNCPVGMEAEEHGSVESITREFNSRVGIQIEAAQHDIYYFDPKSLESNSGIWTIQAGPVYRFRGDRMVPWIHGLMGGGEMQGPDHQNYTPGFTLTGGGGLDLKTPWMSRRLAIRLAEADYEYMRVRYGAPHLAPYGWQPGGIANMAKGFRLSAGIVFHTR
jgi:hypothetical protein